MLPSGMVEMNFAVHFAQNKVLTTQSQQTETSHTVQTIKCCIKANLKDTLQFVLVLILN